MLGDSGSRSGERSSSDDKMNWKYTAEYAALTNEHASQYGVDVVLYI